MKQVSELVRYTTPTVGVKFKKIDVSDISQAVLTIRQGGNRIYKNSFTTDTDTNVILFELSQEETSTLQDGPAFIMCDYIFQSTYRGRSKIMQVNITGPGVEDIMEEDEE